MAILIIGQSTCQICGKVISKNDKWISFPAFVINQLDPVFYYSDSNFHEDCMANHKNSAQAIKLSTFFLQQVKPERRICFISGEPITKMEDHVFIEMLSSNYDSELFSFNFLHFKKSNILSWHRRTYFRNMLIDLNKDYIWKESKGSNDYLHKLILSFS